MNSEALLTTVRWLAKADYYNPTPSFGPVSPAFRRRCLSGLTLPEPVEQYFGSCIPSSHYEANTREHLFRLFSRRDLLDALEDYDCAEKFSSLGFLIVAADDGGYRCLWTL